MSTTAEEIKKFITENGIIISLTLMLVAIIYVNIKVNDLDYRLQQTLSSPYPYQDPMLRRSADSYPYGSNDRVYGYYRPNY
jgi:hypothetical protein